MKLSPSTYIIFGICICIVALTFGWVTMSPNMVEAKNRDDNRALAETEYNKEGQANKRVKGAVKKVQDEAATWREITATKTPSTDLRSGGIDVSENGAQLIVDSRRFRDNIQRAVNKQVKVGGVTLNGDGPSITEPGQTASTILADFYNYPAIPFPVVIFDLGTISVSGTYEQITRNVRAWKDMPNYLAVADGLRIEGTSPHMTGTYAVSIVGYIHDTKLFTTLPEVPGSSAGGGAGGPGGRGGQQQMSASKRAFMQGLSAKSN
jgi:hypothetical protein